MRVESKGCCIICRIERLCKQRAKYAAYSQFKYARSKPSDKCNSALFIFAKQVAWCDGVVSQHCEGARGRKGIRLSSTQISSIELVCEMYTYLNYIELISVFKFCRYLTMHDVGREELLLRTLLPTFYFRTLVYPRKLFECYIHVRPTPCDTEAIGFSQGVLYWRSCFWARSACVNALGPRKLCLANRKHSFLALAKVQEFEYTAMVNLLHQRWCRRWLTVGQPAVRRRKAWGRWPEEIFHWWGPLEFGNNELYLVGELEWSGSRIPWQK